MKPLWSRRDGAGVQRQRASSNAGCRATARRPSAASIELFEEKSFAILFVLLLGVPALPLPTGGATHVFEIIAVLLAAQLIAGRDADLAAAALARARARRARASSASSTGLMRMIRRLERFSRPRLRFLFDHRLSNIVFGLLVIAGCAGAFFAPPFTGLDTLPALGVVLLSLGVLLEDFARRRWARRRRRRGSRWRSCSAAPRSRASGSSSRWRARTDAGEAARAGSSTRWSGARRWAPRRARCSALRSTGSGPASAPLIGAACTRPPRRSPACAGPGELKPLWQRDPQQRPADGAVRLAARPDLRPRRAVAHRDHQRRARRRCSACAR